MKLQLIIGLLIFLLMRSICSARGTPSGYPPHTVKEGMVSGGLYCASYYYHYMNVISAWGDEIGSSYNSYYWFNDNLLHDAGIGANVSDVTGYVTDHDNKVGFGDDGDSMMISNAFLLVEYVEQGYVCGDVTGNDVVETGDVILLSNYVGYPGYTLNNEWAGDVAGDSLIDTGDVILLSNFVGYSGYSLNCTT